MTILPRFLRDFFGALIAAACACWDEDEAGES